MGVVIAAEAAAVGADGATSVSSNSNISAIVVDSATGRRHMANIWQGTFPYGPASTDGHVWMAPVTSFGPQNSYGLHHIIGNVWEWTSTAWCPRDVGTAASDPAAGRVTAPNPARAVPHDCRRGKAPTDPGEVDMVKKGGSFLCHRDSCFRYRPAARHKNTINSSAYNLGFRCVYDRRPKH